MGSPAVAAIRLERALHELDLRRTVGGRARTLNTSQAPRRVSIELTRSSRRYTRRSQRSEVSGKRQGGRGHTAHCHRTAGVLQSRLLVPIGSPLSSFPQLWKKMWKFQGFRPTFPYRPPRDAGPVGNTTSCGQFSPCFQGVSGALVKSQAGWRAWRKAPSWPAISVRQVIHERGRYERQRLGPDSFTHRDQG